MLVDNAIVVVESIARCREEGDAPDRAVVRLTGPEALSMEKLASIISGVTGKPVRFESITDEEYAESPA
mgnify:CR=1 FL=1